MKLTITMKGSEDNLNLAYMIFSDMKRPGTEKVLWLLYRKREKDLAELKKHGITKVCRMTDDAVILTFDGERSDYMESLIESSKDLRKTILANAIVWRPFLKAKGMLSKEKDVNDIDCKVEVIE